MPSQLPAISLWSYLHCLWFHWYILIELFGQVIGPRQQQYLVPVLAGTRHAICMRDWVQCVGSRWGLACVLGLMCRIPLGTSLCVGPDV